MKLRPTAIVPVLIIVMLLPLLTGCGGGGGGHSSPPPSVSGTVTDAAGNAIPGATVEVLDGGRSTKSLFNGVYKMDNLQPGWITLEASAMIDGHQWLGFRAVQIYEEGPTQSMDMVIGPVTELGEFRGAVTDTSGHPLVNARVFASAKYPETTLGADAQFISMVAFTDSGGNYSLRNVPSKISVNGVDQTINYTLTASYAGEQGMPMGFANGEETGAVLPSPQYTVVNFALSVSTNTQVATPSNWTLGISSWTLPDSILTRSPAPYDAIRAHLSPTFAQMLAARKQVQRSAPAGSLIEVDVSWLNSWAAFLDANYGGSPPPNLSGFGIYRRQGSPPTKSDADQLDFVRNPWLMYYGDTSSVLTVGRPYYYGVTAVSTSYLGSNDQFNPDAESAMSNTISVTPIGQLRESSPSQSASIGSTPTFSWQPLAGARSYEVIIYDGYPVVSSGSGEAPDDVPPYWESSVVTGTSLTYDGPAFNSGSTYYWVAVASQSDGLGGPAYSIGELRQFTVR